MANFFENAFRFYDQNTDVCIFLYSIFMVFMGIVFRSMTAQDQIKAAYREADAIRQILHDQIRINEQNQNPFANGTVSYRINSASLAKTRGGQDD